MIKNKKPIPVILVALIILAVGIIIFIYLKPKLLNQKTIEVPSSPPPVNLKSDYKDTFSIELDINEKEINLPQKMSVLELDKEPLPLNYALLVSSKIGFNNQAFQTKDVEKGEVYFWQNDKESVFFYPKIRTIEYTSYTPHNQAFNKNLTDKEIIQNVKSFLINNNIAADSELGEAKIEYLKENQQYQGFERTNKETADIFKVILLPKIAEEYEVITKDAQPLIYALVMIDGKISEVHFTKFNLKKETNPVNYPVKNYQEIKSALPESVLVDLTGVHYTLYDLPKGTIKSIKIKSVQPAYLYDFKKETELLPILLLKGESQTNLSTQTTEAILYLSAFSSNNP